MPGNWNSKKECRSFYKDLCAQRFSQSLVQDQEQLNQQLLSFFSNERGYWGAYHALPHEASVTAAPFHGHAVTWLFPRMGGSELDFCQAREIIAGPFGVMEPSHDSEVVPLKDIQGILVPGLVFNKNGNRLGKGKGFYDRALASFSGKKVGVCFSFQISDKLIPTEPHDVKMDYLLTEQGLWTCR
jgi:5-formyltetrahydrofolate cyclo-ligase